MKQFRQKVCAHCAVDYIPTGPNSVFCSRRCKAKARWASERERRKTEGRPVGSHGGNHGRDNWNEHLRKTGLQRFRTHLRYEVRAERRFCERCCVDLHDAEPFKWCVHHKDHDRTNNNLSNLELLCKRCHQIEHRCWEAFKA